MTRRRPCPAPIVDVSAEQLAATTGLTLLEVIEARSQLEAAGWLTPTGDGRYELTIPPGHDR